MNRFLPYYMFSLFHHDIDNITNYLDFDSEDLLDLYKNNKNIALEQLVKSIYSIIEDKTLHYSSEDISITLTGGMDSRVILAAMLNAGIKPICLTYGNPKNKDVKYSQKIAKDFGLHFHNPGIEFPTKDWYFKWILETIQRDNGNSHLHRAHRTAAIAEHARLYHPKIIFTGHMGGESLRGLTYNNYFGSSFYYLVNEGKMSIRDAASKVLKEYYLKENDAEFDELITKVKRLSWMKHDKATNNFFFLYDLVAKIHHMQDIRLFQSYIPKVIPIYLSKEYLEIIFDSRYNFLAKRKGILGRIQNPFVYCKIIETLCPRLLDYPLVNGFSPKDYLKGIWYYIPIKIYHTKLIKQKFLPTFSYGKWYFDFVKEHSQNINSEIWEVYDKNRYFKSLYNDKHLSDEGYWHKYSNPIFFDLVNKYKNGVL